MDNIDESTSARELGSVRRPAPVRPIAQATAGVDTESETAAFTVTSGPAAGGVISSGAVIASIDDRGGLLVGSGDLSKRKRGRPRKYDPNGSLRTVTSPRAAPTAPFYAGGSSAKKRGRGRPKFDAFASLGELLASTSGGDFTPHVITVHTGEDIAGKILAFAQKGYNGICVLSANGSVSNVTLRQPGSYGGLLTHKGNFEILTLRGSFTISEKHGVQSRKGGLSVSLAGLDGSVVGGALAGSLMASNPVQIVLGTFTTKGFSTQNASQFRVHQSRGESSEGKFDHPDINLSVAVDER